MLSLTLSAGAAFAQQRADEFELRAAYLSRFAPFVEWPSSAKREFHICVVGRDPFGASLDKVVAGQALGSRRMVIRRLPSVGADSDCDLAYVAGSREQSVAAALRSVRGKPILTVTDQASGGDRGMIHFIVQDNRLRFHIDAATATASGLSLSSKFLALAISVRGR